jgi:4a-hydroxytetrahydrobiopterin dehydratase
VPVRSVPVLSVPVLSVAALSVPVLSVAAARVSGMTEPLTRAAASAAVEDAGWRLLLGTLCTSVAVGGLAEGAEVVRAAVDACGPDADRHLHADVRPGRVELSLADRARGAVTARDAELARAVTDAVRAAGGTTAPGPGDRPVQALEIAVDALDIAAVRPFWRAVLGYRGEHGGEGPADALADPAGQGPTVWFQQMDAPRPQRNRIHLDVTVPAEEAEARVAATVQAGGRLLGGRPRAFWVLADPEGNEVCVCSWQDRD